MNGNLLLLVPIILPMAVGLTIKNLDIKRIHRISAITVILNMLILIGLFFMKQNSLEIISVTDQLTIMLKIDQLTVFFTLLAGFLWIMSTFYSFEYMKHEEREERYFRFFLLVLGVIMGIGFAGNMFTFYLFYELMTLITFPLVIHSMTDKSMRAGVKYLVYSFTGAALVLIGIFITYFFAQGYNFSPGGILDISRIAGNEGLLLWGYLFAFIGFGSKAGMYPLHAWLPSAHPVAPAPASGLLSGVITKAGVLGIIRMTHFVFGADLIRGTWVQNLLMILIIFTIFMGSMLAFRTKHMKERLAYSSVSQVSYVLLGIILLNMDGFMGSMLHIIFHAMIKNILFLSVGAIIYKTGKQYVNEIKGIGKSMPITMWCFTLASLGLVGIPPLSGYLSKWYLGTGALAISQHTYGFVAVLTIITSAILTAGYLIPIFVDSFFPGQDFDYTGIKKMEPSRNMTVPLIILSAGVVILGIFPGTIVGYITSIGNLLF